MFCNVNIVNYFTKLNDSKTTKNYVQKIFLMKENFACTSYR